MRKGGGTDERMAARKRLSDSMCLSLQLIMTLVCSKGRRVEAEEEEKERKMLPHK